MRYFGWVVLLGACNFPHGGLGAVRDAPGDGTAHDDAALDARPIDGMPTEGLPSDVEIVVEAEDYTSLVIRGAHNWTSATDVVGFHGTAAMQVLPDDGTACTAAVDTTCSELQYAISIPRTDTYHVHVRIRSIGGADDSLWYGLDGTVEPTQITPLGLYAQWVWRTDLLKTFNLNAGMHTLSVWYRETGIRLDAVAVSTKMTSPP